MCILCVKLYEYFWVCRLLHMLASWHEYVVHAHGCLGFIVCTFYRQGSPVECRLKVYYCVVC